MHTAPPLPPFIHCAHDSPQPPLATPDQLRVAGAAASHVPEAGLPNCWKIGAGIEVLVRSEDEPPPPPLLDTDHVVKLLLIDVLI